MLLLATLILTTMYVQDQALPVLEAKPPTIHLEGYDCLHHVPKISTLSLEDVEECVDNPIMTNSTEHEVQLIQKKTIKEIKTYHCHLSQSYIIYYCGMHSHTSLVKTHLTDETVLISSRDCQELARTENLTLSNGYVIGGIRMNSSRSENVVRYGSVKQDGTCKGTSFAHNGITYNNHVMDVTYKILLSERLSQMTIQSSTLNLPGSLSCPYGSGYCHDAVSGSHAWNVTDTQCLEDEYDVLYEGLANITSKGTQNGVLTISQGDFIFAATIKDITRICNIKVETTAVEGVYVSEKTGKFFQFKKQSLLPVNALMTRYVNAKVGFHAYQASLTSQEIYDKLINQVCQTNRMVLKAFTEIIRNDPTSASRMGVADKGVMARAAGSVVHILKCDPVTVELRMADFCYQEIPVTFNGSSLYLTPHDHMLVAEGMQTPCSDATPPMHIINGQWYAFTPWPVRRIEPGRLTPSVVPGKTYDFDWSTINAAIYSQETLNSLQQFMMFGPRTRAFASSTTADSFGLEIPSNYHLGNYLSDSQITTFKETIKGIYHKILDIGSIVSFFLGLFTIFHLFKYCYDMIQRRMFLKSIGKTGCNICAIMSGTVFHITSLLRTTLATSSQHQPPDVELGIPSHPLRKEQERLLMSGEEVTIESTSTGYPLIVRGSNMPPL